MDIGKADVGTFSVFFISNSIKLFIEVTTGFIKLSVLIIIITV